jgi:hypothetical protein
MSRPTISAPAATTLPGPNRFVSGVDRRLAATLPIESGRRVRPTITSELSKPYPALAGVCR